MNKIISRLLILCLCMPSTQAYAEVPTIDFGNLAANVSNAGTIVSTIIEQKLQDMANLETLMGANKEETGKVVSAVSVQTKVQSETARTIAENEDVAAATRAKQAATVEATIAAKPPASGGCTGRITGQAVGKGGADKNKVAAGANNKRTRYGRVAPPAAQQLATALKGHTDKYCSDEDVQNKLCDRAAKPEMKDADTKANSLFSGAGGNDAVSGETLTYSEEQRQAADDFLKNLTDSGDAPRKLGRAEIGTEDGKHYEALRLVYAARTSIPASQMERIKGRRVAGAGSEATFQQLMEDDTDKGAYFRDRFVPYSKGADGRRAAGNRISELELMKFEVDRRYSNSVWHSNIQRGNNADLLKEIALMMSLQLKFEYEHLRDREMAISIGAQQALTATKEELLPKLKAAEARAMGSAQ